jgi:hypothetical protein
MSVESRSHSPPNGWRKKAKIDRDVKSSIGRPIFERAVAVAVVVGCISDFYAHSK